MNKVVADMDNDWTLTAEEIDRAIAAIGEVAVDSGRSAQRGEPGPSATNSARDAPGPGYSREFRDDSDS